MVVIFVIIRRKGSVDGIRHFLENENCVKKSRAEVRFAERFKKVHEHFNKYRQSIYRSWPNF